MINIQTKVRIPYYAMASIVAVLAGLLTPKAADQSFGRAMLVWLIGCIASGVIGSNIKEEKMLSVVRYSALVSGVMCISLACYYYLRWLIARILNVGEGDIEISFYGAVVNLADPSKLLLAGQLLISLWILTIVFIFLVTISGQELKYAARKLYKFGPHGLDKVNKIILAITGIVASIVALWAAFS